MTAQKIIDGVYQVGGDDLSGNGDCLIYAVDCGHEALVLIDVGVKSYSKILQNLREVGLDPDQREKFTVMLTHAHVDHIGAAQQVREKHPHVKFLAHEGDVPAIEGAPGTHRITAALWYGLKYRPITVDQVISRPEEIFVLGCHTFHLIHTPGHTAGSMSIWLDVAAEGGKHILFGQDIHGPFMEAFGSNLDDYARSMEKLLALEADILCEGHFGIYRGKAEVKNFIQQHLEKNVH